MHASQLDRSDRQAVSVAPIDLDSRGARALRERIPEVVYESGRSTVRVRLSEVKRDGATHVYALPEGSVTQR